MIFLGLGRSLKLLESTHMPLRVLHGSDAVRFKNDVMKNRQEE